MTLVVDIGCPECERVRPVHKLAIGRYRCDACDREFALDEARPR